MRAKPVIAVPMRMRQRGAALAIGLILLVVLTLLAFSGMNAATTGLAMAGNEQYRRSASEAAAGGIELAIANLRNVPTLAGAPTPLNGHLPDGAETARYATTTVYLGDETGLPQSSADKFIGLHYEIQSTGMSLRGASVSQVQGALVIASQRAGEPDTFRRLGTGLTGPAPAPPPAPPPPPEDSP